MSNKTKLKPILTPTVEVVYSTVHRPDTHFGEQQANHNITVKITPELQEMIDETVAESGVTKITGLGTDQESGDPTIKVKTNVFCFEKLEGGGKRFLENASMPHVGPDAKATEMTAARSDLVRLRLQPKVNDRPSTAIAFYLNGIQIVEKNSEFGTGQDVAGFEPVSSGEDDIPF